MQKVILILNIRKKNRHLSVFFYIKKCIILLGDIYEDGYNVDIHEEIILKYGLLIKKEASSSEINTMLDENKKYIFYNLALKYISSRMRSRKEINEYLIKKGADLGTVNEVISLLINEKYIDDYSYSRAFVNDKILLSNDGPNKIRMKLNELGIKEIAVEDALTSFDIFLQKEKINKIAQKQIDTNKNKSANALKNKIVEYLYTLGYDKSLILEELAKLSFKEDNDLAKREYDKIYKKLSKKYSGSELELRVRQKMYALGFGKNN